MRVLHLDTGRTRRGGQIQVARLMRGLNEHRIEQFLAAPGKGPLRGDVAGIPVDFFDLPESNLGRILERNRLREKITSWGVDIIHAHDSHAHTLATFLKGARSKPALVVTRRSVGKIGFGSKTKYVAYDIHFIAISEHIRELLIAGGVVAERITVIPSMIEPAAFSPETGSGSGSDRGIVNIISAGAFDRRKGYHDALAALPALIEKHPGVHYVLYGDGPQKKKLADYVKRQGLSASVDFPGWKYPLKDLNRADIFLSPSYQEGLNSSILEAMAAGVAVVASDIPAHRELTVDGRCGLLFRPGDIPELVIRLSRLIEDKNLRQTLREAAWERVRDFEAPRIVAGIADLYYKVVARHG